MIISLALVFFILLSLILHFFCFVSAKLTFYIVGLTPSAYFLFISVPNRKKYPLNCFDCPHVALHVNLNENGVTFDGTRSKKLRAP